MDYLIPLRQKPKSVSSMSVVLWLSYMLILRRICFVAYPCWLMYIVSPSSISIQMLATPLLLVFICIIVSQRKLFSMLIRFLAAMLQQNCATGILMMLWTPMAWYNRRPLLMLTSVQIWCCKSSIPNGVPFMALTALASAMLMDELSQLTKPCNQQVLGVLAVTLNTLYGIMTHCPNTYSEKFLMSLNIQICRLVLDMHMRNIPFLLPMCFLWSVLRHMRWQVTLRLQWTIWIQNCLLFIRILASWQFRMWQISTIT